MIGLIVLAVVVVYITFWWFVFKKVNRGWPKFVVVLVALAIPFWDLPIGYVNYASHCHKDGGYQEMATLPPYRSVYLASATGHRPEHLLRERLEMVEYSNYRGVIRFRRGPGDAVERIEGEKPESRLRIRAVLMSGSLPWNLSRQEYVVEDNLTGQLLIRARAYTWRGGWLHANSGLPGSIASCHQDSLGIPASRVLGPVPKVHIPR